MTSGDTEASAVWVGDESWEATIDLPINSQHLVRVTFSDRNGDFTLASSERLLITEDGPPQDHIFSADQFNSEQWDNDNDGISNLSAAIRAKDWLDRITRDIHFIISTQSSNFEPFLAADRPYQVDSEEIVPFDLGGFMLENITRETIDIDESGTGSFAGFYQEDHTPADTTTLDHSATRTNTGNSIIWSGSAFIDLSGQIHTTTNNFTLETRKIDDLIFQQDAEFDFRSSSIPQVNMTYSLTGGSSDRPMNCQTTAGTLSFNDGSTTLRFAKSTEDPFWTLTELTDSPNNHLIPGDGAISLDPHFYCAHADL